MAEVQKLRERRDSSLVEQALDELRFAAVENEYVMPLLLKVENIISMVILKKKLFLRMGKYFR